MDTVVCQNSISERRPLPILLVQEIRRKLPMDFPRSRELSCSTRKAAFTPGIAAKLFIGNISQPRSTECQSIEQMGVEKGGPRVRILLPPPASHVRT